jgi:serine/threonine-protein kinase
MTDVFQRLKAALSDRYTIAREIGAGGMAVVYLAEDLKHKRKVAIKVLRPELAATLGSERFLREIEIAAKLSHPHILPLFDSGTASPGDGGSEFMYYVMPFVEGESLRDRVERDGSLEVGDAVRIADQVASALTYAHQRGVVHRDIKPENILMTGDQAIVADFGIARAVEVAGGERLTGTGLALGTPAYMSPEQASGSEDIDSRTDVYALGCVVFEMVGGRPPFEGATPMALLAKHMADTVPSLRTSDPRIPLFVERAVERALAKAPEDRFASASAFVQALTSGTVVARVRPRHFRRNALVGAAFVVVAVAAFWIARVTGTPGVRALAVLPLTNLSGDTAQVYFVEGVHEALISELAQTGVTVIARGSVLQYRNHQRTLREIARELEVDAVLEGGVFRDGDSVEIETRLIDVNSDLPIWNGAYDGNLPNVVALYRGIARAIAGEIDVALNPEAETRLDRSDTVDPEVYEAYLKGMYHLNRATPQDIAQGLRYLHDAVDRNPVDARSWAGLAYGYITIGHSFAPTPDARARAIEAAERTVRLDPTLADGWAALAAVKTYYEYDWEAAEQAFKRANELNPSLPMNHYHYAWYLALFGRLDEAIVEHERAQALDPFTPLHTAWLGQLYAQVGRFEDGIREAEKAQSLQTVAPLGSLALGMVYDMAGQSDSAIAVLEAAAAAAPPLVGFLGIVYSHAGREDDARAIASALETAPPSAMSSFVLAQIHATFGDIDRAIYWLEYDPPHVWLPWFVTSGPLIPQDLRLDPRFQALLRRMNLSDSLSAG